MSEKEGEREWETVRKSERERISEKERKKDRGGERFWKLNLESERDWARRNNLITDKLIPLNSAELVYTVSCACLFLLTE
jgi:hypothetical protein